MSISSSLVIARSQNKQTLKDAFRRLKRIRATCGEEDLDEEELKSKDPLLACIRNFEMRVGDAEELLMLPVDQVFSDQDKLHLRRAILGAQQELKTMEDMLAAAEARYNTAEIKNKKPEKIQPLEAERDRIKQAFDQAQECMSDMKKTQTQREADQQAMIEKEGRSIFGKKKANPDAELGSGISVSREPITAADGGKAQKRTMSKAMDILARSQGVAADDDLNDNQGMDSAAYQWDSSVSLATDKETKQQYAQISKQKREVAASLHRIHEGVQRLHEMSKVMAVEIETQSHRIDSLETRVEERQQKLQDLNEKVEKLNESMKPMNFCFNIFCFLLLLAIVGYLLYYYDVVSV